MTVNEAANALSAAGISSALREARMLAEHICGIPDYRLPLVGDDELGDEYGRAVYRRASREPLQYIIGKWWFYGREFFVNENCLIPRPETEMLVDIAKSRLAGGRLLDLCTGSGCVALSILAELPEATAVAVDISHEALAVARRNCEALHLSSRCEFLEADVTVPPVISEKFDVITANPPYIAADDMPLLEPELSYEPPIALTDGKDGLSVVGGIIRNYAALLADDGVMAIEIGADEGDAATALAKDAGLSASVMNDLSGKCRVLVCKKQQYA